MDHHEYIGEQTAQGGKAYFIDPVLKIGIQAWSGYVNYHHKGSRVMKRASIQDDWMREAIERAQIVTREECMDYARSEYNGTNVDYVREMREKGIHAYLIDDYDERALSFDLSLEDGELYSKKKGSRKINRVKSYYDLIFKSILIARIATREEFEAY